MDEAFRLAKSLREQAAKLGQMRKEGGAPSVGVFFFIDGEVYAYPEPVKDAERMGPYALSKLTHYDLFKTLEKTLPKLKQLKGRVTYACFRRGRVVCDTSQGYYAVHLSEDIPSSATGIVAEEFGLARFGDKVDFLTDDPEYNRSYADQDQLATAIAETGVEIE